VNVEIDQTPDQIRLLCRQAHQDNSRGSSAFRVITSGPDLEYTIEKHVANVGNQALLIAEGLVDGS
jgi:hypothetical protein